MKAQQQVLHLVSGGCKILRSKLDYEIIMNSESNNILKVSLGLVQEKYHITGLERCGSDANDFPFP